uniref:Uncharacterized protein n=1 Tax=Hyaloperonospora arabidopsidis (strain Emoy2) TaxID=559515 RepID=M4BW76_HYAAE
MLTDENYFLWEFTTWMELARKRVLEHVLEKPDTLQQSSTWKTDDPKALDIIVKCKSAYDAWDTLRSFFVQQNLHNKLVDVGETIDDDEKLVILLESLLPEYDMMIRIIEATSGVTLMRAKEMLRREYETL